LHNQLEKDKESLKWELERTTIELSKHLQELGEQQTHIKELQLKN
jgi:hypothetical protein